MSANMLPVGRLELLNKQTGEITVLDPGGALVQDTKHDAVIRACARLGDWKALESEIDRKLDDQQAVIEWWSNNVAPNSRPKISNTVPHYFSVADAETLTGISQPQISRWRKKLKDRMSYRASIVTAALKKYFADASSNHLAQSSGENEWYTPPEIIERARSVLGEIDLDPASNAEANETVKAAAYYTQKDNGLGKEWHGRVWINPPYSRDLMPAFVAKLIAEYRGFRTTAAILLSHNNTETNWFQSLAAESSAICFPSTRIKFYRGENVAAPVNGQVFFYLGPNPGAFADAFRPLGIIVAYVNGNS